MIPLEQAVRASSVLSAITQRVAQSQQLLRLVLPLLPPPLLPLLLLLPRQKYKSNSFFITRNYW